MTFNHENDVAILRAFSRVYVRRSGLLAANYEGSPFTVSEARIMYELANGQNLTGAGLARLLRLDPAQVSRTLKRFSSRGLVAICGHSTHGRQQIVSLTDEGRAAFEALDASTQDNVGRLVQTLHPLHRSRLMSAASTIIDVFANTEPRIALRKLRPGDLGLVIARQSILYAEEYDWNIDYEGLVARILSDFHHSFDASKDDAWIADVDGCMAGSIFLVHGHEPAIGKLRLLYVEPTTRGLGVGKQLVSICIKRAIELGYERLDLWTNTILVAARRIYEEAGFTLIDEAPHHSFGHDLTGQTWSLKLLP